VAHRILIVDDSVTIRGLIKRTLGLCGLDIGECFEAGDGIEALEKLKEHRVDLILADLHMPRMNGMELAKAVLADPKTASIPVAVISAEPNASRLLELRKAGVKGCLRKPCTPEALRDMITPFLEASNA
jgi:two-component system chemotaxis response regulator CheY